ncbi:MAG: hypothetical protein HFJ45_06055 [Clostridia bacterium]|nr:hypothetical protein [Clostridia bacterium]
MEKSLSGISSSIYGDRDNIFNNFCNSLNKVDASLSWNEALNSTHNSLKDEDREVLSMLGKMLGKTDKFGQIQEIDIVSKFLDKQIENSEEEKRKNEKLYKTLGIVCGLTLAIILV